MRTFKSEDLEPIWLLTSLLANLGLCYWSPQVKKKAHATCTMLAFDKIIMVNYGAGPGYHRMMQQLYGIQSE